VPSGACNDVDAEGSGDREVVPEACVPNCAGSNTAVFCMCLCHYTLAAASGSTSTQCLLMHMIVMVH
jgi:hypothetical protein